MNYLSYLFSKKTLDDSKQITYQVEIQSGNKKMVLDTTEPVKSYYNLMNFVVKTNSDNLNTNPTIVKLVGDNNHIKQFTTFKSITDILTLL